MNKNKCPKCQSTATVRRFGFQMWLMCDANESHEVDLGDHGN